MKRYVAVEWLDGKHSVIPSEWLVPQEGDSATNCAFYPKKNAVKKAKDNVVPNSNWATYEFIRVLASSRK